MMKILKSQALAVAVLTTSSLSGLAQAGAIDFTAPPGSYATQQASNGDGCFVTFSPTEAARTIRHWRPSCAEWFIRIEKRRLTKAGPGEAP